MRIDVVYDGLCAFCIRSLGVLQRLDARHVIAAQDANDRTAVDASFPMLRDADLDTAMYAVDSSGRAYRGFFAFRRLARELPAAWPLLPLLYLPGMGRVGPLVYGVIARNRNRLGCRVD